MSEAVDPVALGAMSDAVEIPPLLAELLIARGPSGYETAPTAAWAKAASEFAEVRIDVMGTPAAMIPAKGGSEAGVEGGIEAGVEGGSGRLRRLLILGHIDEIGLIVTHIDEKGFLWFREVGGWDAQILVGQRVILQAGDREVSGAIGKKPIHLLRDEERKKVAEVRDLHIDIGAKDKEQAEELVRIGDVAVLSGDPVPLPNRRLLARALDNRLGSFVALQAARIVSQAGGVKGWEVVAAAAAQEETTFGGSRTSAFSLAPDAAIVIDVTHATDAPGIDVKESGSHELGSGPVITRGSTLHPTLFEHIFETGKAEKIPFTVDASGRHTGTDADAVHMSRGGVPTALVSIPLRYMHSPVELVSLDDVEACAALVSAAALRLSGATSLKR